MAPPVPMTNSRDSEHIALQRILDAVLDGVIVLSASGAIERINEEACRVLESSTETARGKPLDQLSGPNHPIIELARQVQKTRQPVVEDDVRLARRFGPDVELDLAVSPVSDEQTGGPGGVVVVLHDRTIGNTLRKEATQLDELASYGHIAAGIAHEVKNPLGGIRGAAELIELRAEDERTRRTAHVIVREVDRITGLVEELMVFARSETLRLAPVNLHRLIDEVLEVVAAEPATAQVAFERVFDPSIPELVADADRLTQVFLNLARNAVQALEEQGGRLEITTRMQLQHRLVGRGPPPRAPRPPRRPAGADRRDRLPGRRSGHLRGDRRSARHALLHHQARRHRAGPRRVATLGDAPRRPPAHRRSSRGGRTGPRQPPAARRPFRARARLRARRRAAGRRRSPATRRAG